ncbi:MULTISPECIES: hypothetical protein [Sphingobium]|uniref:hypothetical protein n=1 Tax=Sphingobium TaxID=165695 RepID=UPI000A9F4B90|nr:MULTISPECIES: hypothetical protein [Sphingobium]WDA37720.1 hypothetical protein PO876_05940 [Sphingobium sp. YC-XJ3]
MYFRSGSRYDHDWGVDIEYDVDCNQYQFAASFRHELHNDNVVDDQRFHDDEHCL